MSPAPSVIKAKHFVVTGDKGQVLATMGADSEGDGYVTTANAEGKPLAGMGAGLYGMASLGSAMPRRRSVGYCFLLDRRHGPSPIAIESPNPIRYEYEFRSFLLFSYSCAFRHCVNA